MKNYLTSKTECFNELQAFETASWPIMEATRICYLSILSDVDEYIQNVTVIARNLLVQYVAFKTTAEECTKQPGSNYNGQLVCIDNVSKT